MDVVQTGPSSETSISPGTLGRKYNMSSRSRLSFDYSRYQTKSTPLTLSTSRQETETPLSLSANRVFHITELLELILLSLPGDTTQEEIASMRTILLGRTTCSTWSNLIQTSLPLRRRLYLSSPNRQQTPTSNPWHEQSAYPPARPNPWAPRLLLHTRSWGSAYPFDNTYSAFPPTSSATKIWTFSFELSRAQYTRLPAPGPWRDMLAASPPFTDFWFTRCFYESATGRVPRVMHWDFDPKLPKARQKYRVHCKEGITLGMLADAFAEMFETFTNARYVIVESL